MRHQSEIGQPIKMGEQRLVKGKHARVDGFGKRLAGVEAFDLNEYDIVISSSHCVVKGVVPAPGALHISYIHSPMRYIWDHQAQYRDMSGFVSRLGMEMFSNGLRIWDVSSAQRVDAFAANSSFVRQRIRKYYRRDATIIPPPVEIDQFRPTYELWTVRREGWLPPFPLRGYERDRDDTSRQEPPPAG